MSAHEEDWYLRCSKCGMSYDVHEVASPHCDGEEGEPALAVPPEYERAVEALRGLAGWTGDVLRGWQAHKQLAEGFGGMGHNILVEDAGKYGSLSIWLRVERALTEARAALAAVDAARGKP